MKVHVKCRILETGRLRHLEQHPTGIRGVDVNTLATMNGRKVKDKVRAQWELKPRSFRVDRAANLLIMTINDQRDRNDFRKDVPSHVYSDTREDKIIMWLDEAEEYLGLHFSHSPLKRFLAPFGIA